MIAVEEIRKRIEQALTPVHVDVVDQTGTGDHFQALVVSAVFEGKTRVQQHQLVYAALGDHMRERIHALALRTLTPDQWQEGGR